MSVYHLALALAAIVTLGVSWRLARARLWIGALAASFVVSVSYLYLAPKGYTPYGWFPPASVIAGFCDASIAIGMYFVVKRRWEIALYMLVVMSVMVNAVYASGEIMGFPPLPPHWLYAAILEAINYVALLLIGGTAILDRLGERDAVGRTHLGRRVVGGVHLARDTLKTEAQPSKALRSKADR